MSPAPSTAREIRVAGLPAGLPGPGDLAVVEAPVPVPGQGEVLVRNRFFIVLSALRTLLAGGVPGAPLPRLSAGDALFGPAVGEVVAAPGGGALKAGDLVRHVAGWREYAVVPETSCDLVPDGLPDPADCLAQGATAYGALTAGAGVSPGDTVFVSGGAGSVGSVAGQVARLLGAGRVIGGTGSAWKAGRLTEEFGYDAAVVRGAAPLADQLRAAAPDGIDVFFDTTGGEELRAAITVARPLARFVLVGALSGQVGGTGTAAPVEIDSVQLIVKQIALRGYAGGDPGLRAEWDKRYAGWLRSGAITFPYTRVEGIEQAPKALHDVLAGSHAGTVVVAL